LVSGGTALYFAFGSNLQQAQMTRRCPSATVWALAKLDGHRLAFTGQSRGWGSGVATVVEDPYAWTAGVVYSVTRDDLARLDRYEGHPHCYQRHLMTVTATQYQWHDVVDVVVRAWVYRKHDETANLPAGHYLDAVRRGYDEHGLDTLLLDEALAETRYLTGYC
jgi:gamma-glutamylcyclotransferase (GGCT)/AIG2-like uncharacterized protein YtfP